MTGLRLKMSTETAKWQIPSFCATLKLKYRFMAYAALPHTLWKREFLLTNATLSAILKSRILRIM